MIVAAAVIAVGTVISVNGALGQTAPPTKVLFMCPHGAAKSVLASAYFHRAAQEHGLNVQVEAVGTEPDEAVSPVVARHLRQKGYVVPVTKPRAVTSQDLEAADLVISMGCDVSRLPVRPTTLRRWDEVPGPSEDLEAAAAAIQRRVLALIEELRTLRK